MSIHDCRLIELPKISDPRGNLSFVEGGNHIPFDIKRIYYLYGVPHNEIRGGHAHKMLHQLMLPISGSFCVELNDGHERESHLLESPNIGLYICPMIWRDLSQFSPHATCVVLASDYYAEDDYYRNYEEFIVAINKARSQVTL